MIRHIKLSKEKLPKILEEFKAAGILAYAAIRDKVQTFSRALSVPEMREFWESPIVLAVTGPVRKLKKLMSSSAPTPHP